MRRGLFVTATDTGVGKTVASAALMHAARRVPSVPSGSDTHLTPAGTRFAPSEHNFGPKSASMQEGSDTHLTPKYWKPIQTGIEQDDDTSDVRRLGACSDAEILARGVRLTRPLSPHLSARLSGASISIEDVMRIGAPDIDRGTWIVEGAGGVLVPLNDSELMIDLMVRLALPVAIVTRTTLGTINHTLLTIEALRARALRIAGAILVGEPNADNREAIAKYGSVRILGEMPRFNPLTPAALGAWARAHLDLTGAL